MTVKLVRIGRHPYYKVTPKWVKGCRPVTTYYLALWPLYH